MYIYLNDVTITAIKAGWTNIKG